MFWSNWFFFCVPSMCGCPSNRRKWSTLFQIWRGWGGFQIASGIILLIAQRITSHDACNKFEADATQSPAFNFTYSDESWIWPILMIIVGFVYLHRADKINRMIASSQNQQIPPSSSYGLLSPGAVVNPGMAAQPMVAQAQPGGKSNACTGCGAPMAAPAHGPGGGNFCQNCGQQN
jgi:hypothetical protein